MSGAPVEVSATIKAVKTGDWEIAAQATRVVEGKEYTVAYEADYVSVFEDHATVNDTVPRTQGIPKAVPAAPPVIIPVTVQLALSEPPLVGKTVKLSATFAVAEGHNADVLNASARVALSPGFHLVAGELAWHGDIMRGTPVQIKATVRALQKGKWTISAQIDPPKGVPATGGRDALHITITEDSATISHDEGPSIAPPPAPAPTPQRLGTADFQNKLTIVGGFYCRISENSVPLQGQRNDEEKQMVSGTVRVYDTNNNYLGQNLTGGTDNPGAFTIDVENPHPQGFYIQIIPISGAAEVTRPDGSLYIVQTQSWYPAEIEPEPYDIGWWGMPDILEYNGAWRIYETVVNDYYDRGAWDFLTNEGPALFMPLRTIIYPTNLAGSSYDPTTDIIHIKNDTDTKALDAVQHEYGHAVMDYEYAGGMPVAPPLPGHDIPDISHPITAWVEGWADFSL